MASAIEYAILSTRTYPRTQKNITNLPEGWVELVKSTNNSITGFSASAYQKGTEIVIAYTGTNETKIGDTVFANYPAFVGNFAPQVLEAILFFLEIEKQYANGVNTVSFTGHSLGGGLASLMGMFFDRQATAFDPAPFQATLRNSNTLMEYQEWLKKINVDDKRFNDLISDIPGVGRDIYSERSAGIFYYYLQGEFLNALRFSTTNIGTLWWPVGEGKQSTSGLTTAFDLHSMSLLTALLKSEKLEEMGSKVDDSFAPFFDSKMYAKDPATSQDVNFLDKLLNAQIGNLAEGVQPIMLLDKYATDILKLQGYKGVAQTKLLKELFAVAGDYYYNKENSAITKVFTVPLCQTSCRL